MSLVYAFQSLQKEPVKFFTLLGRCLAALKEGGVLYMDLFTVKDYLVENFGEEKLPLIINYLEGAVGNRLVFEEISLSDFLPQVQGDQSNIVSFTLKNTELLERGNPTVSTSSLTAITRTAEKVTGEKLSEEELWRLLSSSKGEEE